MNKSIIASSHHYYVMFLQSPEVKTLQKFLSLTGAKPHLQILKTWDQSANIYHFQLEIQSAYGSESLLEVNRSSGKNRSSYFWYDFYCGYADKEASTFFICYPYSKLNKFIVENILDKASGKKFYKAKVHEVLKYIKERGQKKRSKVERDGFQIDITKYSAEIKEEANANKVSLLGANPLNSKIFDVLTADKSISIEATALKLKCKKEKYDLELSFDRLGNFRFWLKKDDQENALPNIKYLFQFFSEIDSLHSSNFLSAQTLLEDE